jgi:superfamily II DNA or RNA helicase
LGTYSPMTKIVISDRIYVPADKTTLPEVKRHYQRQVYKQSTCDKCPVLPERHSVTCDNCPAYLGIVKLWNQVEIKNATYFAVPTGHPERVSRLLNLDLSRALDRRPVIPMQQKVEWRGSLWKGQTIEGEEKPDQVALVERWLKKYQTTGGGLIQAAPRTGKTCVGVYLTCKLRVKTLITASQNEFLQQFCMRFAELTNIREISPKGRKSPILILCPQDWNGINLKDGKHCGCEVITAWNKASRPLEDYDVVLTCYQQFIHPKYGPPKIVKYLYNKFTFCVIDEVDQANADAYSKFLNHVPFKYKLGLTATVQRTDGLEFVVRDIIGPVVAKSVTTALIPQIELLETGVGQGKEYATWWRIERFLATHEGRNKQIVRQIFQDLRANPKHSILVPVRHIKHMKLLADMINLQAQINNQKRNETWPKTLAITYSRGVIKEQAMRMIERYECRVVIAISKMMTRGIDLKAWTHTYIGVIPTSSFSFFYQLANRVGTPYLGKPQPIVRQIIDAMPASLHCFKKLFWTEIAKHLSAKQDQPPRYKMETSTRKRAFEIAQHPQLYSIRDAVAEVQKISRQRLF